MSDFGKIVREVLEENACNFVRHGKGDHDIWYSKVSIQVTCSLISLTISPHTQFKLTER